VGNGDRRRDFGWTDVAKSTCITLVVLMHCSDQFSRLPWADAHSVFRTWTIINALIRPIRMPVFFLISGVLASQSILFPGRTTVRNRLLQPLYLYSVWSLIYLLTIQPMAPQSSLLAWFAMLSIGMANLMVLSWYFVALAIFYVLARHTARVPAPAILAACALLSIIASVFEQTLPGHQAKVLRCAIFFVAGVRAKPQIGAFVQRANLQIGLLLCGGYLAGAVVCITAGTFLLPVDVAATAAALALCGLAVRHAGALARPLQWLAERTLPIYALHFLVLRLFTYVLEASGTPIFESHLMGILCPILATPLVMICSLATFALLRKLGGSWLFGLPALGPSQPPALQAKPYPLA
jgi:uncharacterized membrane protein YcfT